MMATKIHLLLTLSLVLLFQCLVHQIEAVPTPNSNAEIYPLAAGNQRLARQYDWRLERMRMILQAMKDRNAMQPGLDAAARIDRLLDD